jgi:hypothetical protein
MAEGATVGVERRPDPRAASAWSSWSPAPDQAPSRSRRSDEHRRRDRAAPRPLAGVGWSSSRTGWPGRPPAGCSPTGVPNVVKVEPHGGEPMRHIWGSMGANPTPLTGRSPRPTGASGRSSSTSLGRRARRPRRPPRAADVLVSNLRPAALRRLGLDPDGVAERFPRLVYCSLHRLRLGRPRRGARRVRPGLLLRADRHRPPRSPRRASRPPR